MTTPAPTQTPSPTQALLQRLTKNLSQGQIAQKTGISQPRLSRWLKGEVNGGADDVFKLQQLESEITGGAKKSKARDTVK